MFRSNIVAALLGTALALTMPPMPTGLLCPLILAILFVFIAKAEAKDAAIKLFVAMTACVGVHLYWLVPFLGKLFQVPILSGLALCLFALEGIFFAILAILVFSIWKNPLAKVWGLAGGWVLLEWLRSLGAFAFPWPSLGYSLVGTPYIQTADIGGIFFCSAIITTVAAALASSYLNQAKAHLYIGAAIAVVCASGLYGISRQPIKGHALWAVVLRTEIDNFAKAGGYLSPSAQVEKYLELSAKNAGMLIWPETAVQSDGLLGHLPKGIYGIERYSEGAQRNQAFAWDGYKITEANDKAKPVPFGEFFPLRKELAPIWRIIERSVGFGLESTEPAKELKVLTLGGVNYGAYVCYDSVFPWVARKLSLAGAEVLVNISNDGWYTGWGVKQHFLMGSVRAIENRRYVLRSVNSGMAGVIDDMGTPIQTLSSGEGPLRVKYLVPYATSKTVYQQLGELPWILIVLANVLLAIYLERKAKTKACRA